MNRTAIVLPALIVFGYIFWTFGDAMKEHQREVQGNFDHQPHRWNKVLSVNAKLYGDLTRICVRPSESPDRGSYLDRIAYCVGDEAPMPGFAAPFDAKAPGAMTTGKRRRCACVGRLQSAQGSLSWSVRPEDTPHGKARVVYGLRGDIVERIDATFPLDSYAKWASELPRWHVAKPQSSPDGAIRWHRKHSTAELVRNPRDVRLSFIGGDEHYTVSGKSRPILRVVSSWLE